MDNKIDINERTNLLKNYVKAEIIEHVSKQKEE